MTAEAVGYDRRVQLLQPPIIFFNCSSSSRSRHLRLAQLGSPKLPAVASDFVSASSALRASLLGRVYLGTCWRGPVLDTSVSDILLVAKVHEKSSIILHPDRSRHRRNI